MLPGEMRGRYRGYCTPKDENIRAIVHAADKLSAYIKCLEEIRAGNGEFRDAARLNKEKLDAMDMPELDIFFAEFLPSFSLTVDEMG
jgi:5'-deoxynucleotidase